METTIQNSTNSIERVEELNIQATETRRTDISLSLEQSLEAIKLAKSISFEKGLAKALLNAGIASRLLSDFNSAIKYNEEALSIYKKLDDKKGETRTINSLANVYMFLGNHHKAIELYDECVYILESIGDIEFTATVITNKGLCYQKDGDYRASINNYLESLSIYKTINKEIHYSLFNNLGIVYLEIGNYSIAMKYFNHALRLLLGINEASVDQSYVIANIGRTFLYMEDFTNAVTYLTEALLILKKMGDLQAESQVYANLGKAYLKLKCYPEAVKYYNKALKYYKEIGDRSSVSHTLCEMGELYFELNDFITCKRYFNEGLSISVETTDEINEVRTYIGLGRLYLKFTDLDSANNFLSKAIKLSKSRNAYKDLQKIYSLLHEGYLAMGINKEATEYFEKYNQAKRKLMNIEEENILKAMFTNHNSNLYDKPEPESELKLNGEQTVVNDKKKSYDYSYQRVS